MSPDDASNGRVVRRNVYVDSVAGKDANIPPPLHSPGRPGSNLQTTLDLDDERRISV